MNETSPHGEAPQPAAPVIDISTREERPPAPTFDDFWAVWPRKVGKLDARKAWDKAIREGSDPFEIIAGAHRLAAVSSDKQYIKYPQGWLNGHRWEDEDEDLPQARPVGQPARTTDAFEADSYRGKSRFG